VSGIPAVIFDTVSLHVMAQSAVLPSSAADLPKVPIHSPSPRALFMMVSYVVVMLRPPRWVWCTR
jgi:hypothetical protein